VATAMIGIFAVGYKFWGKNKYNHFKWNISTHFLIMQWAFIAISYVWRLSALDIEDVTVLSLCVSVSVFMCRFHSSFLLLALYAFSRFSLLTLNMIACKFTCFGGLDLTGFVVSSKSFIFQKTCRCTRRLREQTIRWSCDMANCLDGFTI